MLVYGSNHVFGTPLIFNQKNSSKAGWEIKSRLQKRACGILVQFNPPSVMQINLLTERGPKHDSGTYKRTINIFLKHLCPRSLRGKKNDPLKIQGSRRSTKKIQIHPVSQSGDQFFSNVEKIMLLIFFELTIPISFSTFTHIFKNYQSIY